jgi:cardiolipin synthase
VWALVGSMQFDNRSLALNQASNLATLDRGVGAVLDSLCLDDLRSAREVRLTEFTRRPPRERAVEAGAALMSGVL